MRGQTTLDFALGIVIFLAVIVFVFSFVPGILEPFDVGQDAEPAVADRIANSLAQDTLGSTEEPYVLDRYCAVAFFNESRSDPPDECNYEDMSLRAVFDLSATVDVNVTLLGNVNESNEGSNLLCWTEETVWGSPANEPGLDELVDCDSGDTTLAKGNSPPTGGQSTITARRVVSLHDQTVTMRVVVW